jgi:hypothetical protein
MAAALLACVASEHTALAKAITVDNGEVRPIESFCFFF